MNDETHATERASVALVYKLLGELDDKMDSRFAELRQAIDSLRDSFVLRGEWQMRNETVDTKIADAVKASECDREKIWSSIHGFESALKWAAGIAVTTLVGLFVYLMQGHIIP